MNDSQNIYAALVGAYGFDPLAERELRVDLETIEVAA